MKGFFSSLTVLVAASSALGLSYMLSETEPSWASSNDDNATSNLGISTTAATATTTTSKELTMALLTDALFSDAGWGAFGYNAASITY
jgi:basic membrane protein A